LVGVTAISAFETVAMLWLFYSNRWGLDENATEVFWPSKRKETLRIGQFEKMRLTYGRNSAEFDGDLCCVSIKCLVRESGT